MAFLYRFTNGGSFGFHWHICPSPTTVKVLVFDWHFFPSLTTVKVSVFVDILVQVHQTGLRSQKPERWSWEFRLES